MKINPIFKVRKVAGENIILLQGKTSGDMTLQEIADTFGISQPAVSKRLKTAQERLKTMLREESV